MKVLLENFGEDSPSLLGEFGNERLVDRALNEETACAKTDFTLVEKTGSQKCSHTLTLISVGKNNRSVLAAHLKQKFALSNEGFCVRAQDCLKARRRSLNPSGKSPKAHFQQRSSGIRDSSRYDYRENDSSSSIDRDNLSPEKLRDCGACSRFLSFADGFHCFVERVENRCDAGTT